MNSIIARRERRRKRYLRLRLRTGHKASYGTPWLAYLFLVMRSPDILILMRKGTRAARPIRSSSIVNVRTRTEDESEFNQDNGSHEARGSSYTREFAAGTPRSVFSLLL